MSIMCVIGACVCLGPHWAPWGRAVVVGPVLAPLVGSHGLWCPGPGWLGCQVAAQVVGEGKLPPLKAKYPRLTITPDAVAILYKYNSTPPRVVQKGI